MKSDENDGIREADLQSLLREGKEKSANDEFWMKLAKQAIKQRDFEVSLYCVTKMKMARVARDARRKLDKSKTPSDALAIISINLGDIDEAEKILKESNDHEALCRLYQDLGKWTEAIETASQMNLPTVYYNYAKQLESEGKFSEAIKYYELSNTHAFEVPRMLYSVSGNNASLAAYCNRDINDAEESSSKIQSQLQLYKWWAQYSESIKDMEEAIKAYMKAKDYYNLIRLLCATGQIERGKEMIEQLMNQNLPTSSHERRNLDAALLFLAKQQESNGGNASEAVAYYLACGAIKHALRACKNASMVNEMVKIIVTYGSKEDAKSLIGKYLNRDEANEISSSSLIKLYYKCGSTNKAIRKSIESRNWTQLREIVTEEAEKTAKGESPSINESVIEDALEALRSDSEIVDIVIDLILLCKSSKEYLLDNIIQEYNVQVDDALIERVEALTTSRGSSDTLTQLLADLSLKQGRYLIAAKMFNSIGDRINSVKALIRSGDTEKVIKYAMIARNKSVYKITANYLQTVDYHDEQLVSSLYKKASASEELTRYQKKL